MSPMLARSDLQSIPPAALSELELGVIKEARRRQRRRWRAIAGAALAAAAVAIIVSSGGGINGARPVASSPPPQFGPGTNESPSAVFAQDPYMGVSCHVANSIACDRVGLSVWLRRPASVVATIAGVPLRLDAPHWSYVAHDQRRAVYVYAGFLQPAGLTTRLHFVPKPNTETWLGTNAPSPSVWFRIDYGHGNVVITHENVFLSAGWG